MSDIREQLEADVDAILQDLVNDVYNLQDRFPKEVVSLKTLDKSRAVIDKCLSLLNSEWEDAPTKRGDYWMSAFIEGNYISPRILSVIDYERTDRGLEVQYDFLHDTIPVKTFTKEYYPNAKWMLIQEPAIISLPLLKEEDKK